MDYVVYTRIILWCVMILVYSIIVFNNAVVFTFVIFVLPSKIPSKYNVHTYCVCCFNINILICIYSYTCK